MASPDSRQATEVQSILVIHQGALGDFILALPALESIRRAFPRARRALMGYPRILELVRDRSYGEDIFSVDQRGMASFFVLEGTLDLTLAQFFETFDLIVMFGKDAEGPVIKNLRRVCRGRILHINSFPPWDEKVHLTDHLLRQVESYGFPPSTPVPMLHLKESDRAWAREFWKNEGVTPEERSKVIVFHPGSGSKKKVWPLERFLDLRRALHHHLGSKSLVVLGPSEGPEVWEAFERKDPDTLTLAKGLTLLQLASVMEGCRFFVGNDSGVSHMAAALGLPTVAIFGPTDRRVWSPRGKRAAVVYSGIPCSPCPQERFFRCKSSKCLRAIEVDEVLEGLGRIGIQLES